MKDKLLGELIGLARVTDGNEHLISDASNAVLRQGLLAAASENPEEMTLALEKLTEQKKQMVPNCFICANPCGKNAAFDLKELENDPEKEAKGAILRLLQTLAGKETGDALLYTGLIAVGISGIERKHLDRILHSLEETL